MRPSGKSNKGNGRRSTELRISPESQRGRGIGCVLGQRGDISPGLSRRLTAHFGETVTGGIA